jgi:predicted phosphoadenosine phosphosulfate sulfurtransferase
MCPILDGYGVTTVFYARTRPRVNRSTSWWVAIFSQLQTGRSCYLDTWVVPKACGEMRSVWVRNVGPARFTTER